MMKLTLSALALTAAMGAAALPLLAQETPAPEAGMGPMEGPMHEMVMERFAEFDADGDGKVTEAEIDAYRAGRVASLDADKDGFLTAQELTAFYMAEAQERVAKRVEGLMERSDADGDGKIGAAEMMMGRGGEMGERMFDRADADGDGAVSMDEAGAMMARMAEMREGRGDGPRGMGRHGGHGEGRGWFGRWR